jgi:hypothetical protein
MVASSVGVCADKCSPGAIASAQIKQNGRKADGNEEKKGTNDISLQQKAFDLSEQHEG